MPEQVKRNFAPQFVGLGGTGSDVIASLMRNKRLILPLLNTDGVRLSCMALDVANAQAAIVAAVVVLLCASAAARLGVPAMVRSGR